MRLNTLSNNHEEMLSRARRSLCVYMLTSFLHELNLGEGEFVPNFKF